MTFGTGRIRPRCPFRQGLAALVLLFDEARVAATSLLPAQTSDVDPFAQALEHAGAEPTVPPAEGHASFVFQEWPAERSGVTFRHRAGAEGAAKRFMIECVGAGLGLLDVDDDGDLDLYLVQSGTVGKGGEPLGAADALYLNDGSAAFHDAGAAAGELSSGFGSGVTAGDVDGDGDEDLFVANLGPNDLLLNGSAESAPVLFRRASEAGGLAGDVHDWSMSCAFADLDRDGDLDAYVTNYLAHDLSHPMLRGGSCRWLGCPVPCGPKGLAPQRDRLYLNDGGGSFRDVTAETAFAQADPAYSFQPIFSDVDDDGDADLFVANDSVANGFYSNQGPGEDGLPRFVSQGLRSGLALSAEGREQAGMGVAVGDLDGDLRDEIVVTNFARESNAVYRNASTAEHGALFFDESGRFGLARASYFPLGWGACLLDADTDGDLDLFVANGHVYPQVDGCGLSGVTFCQRSQLFEQVAPGRLAEVVPEGGGLLPPRAARGAAAGDLDGDGDVDLALSVLDGVPVLLRNDTPPRGRWLTLDLRPVAASVGARATLRTGSHVAAAEVRRGSSFLCTEDRRLRFGLPPGEEGFVVSVRWPDGLLESWTALPCCRVLRLDKGEGQR